MKKIISVSLLALSLCALAYTSEDTSNANYLGDQKIIVKQTTASKYRLDDKILRQEVIGMALKVKGITLPENYTCKKYFMDATKNDWVCRAVELAADNGIITRSNKYANPGKSITRAEALSMMINALGIKIQNSEIHFMENDGIGWQRDVISTVLSFGLWKNNEVKTTYNGNLGMKTIFSPDQSIIRHEVFQFLYNGLELLEARKSVINIDFKVLDTHYQADLSMISSIKKPCIDPKDTFQMSYGPDKEAICGTPEYQQSNIVFEKSIKDFISGKYKENLTQVCRLFAGIYEGCANNIRIEKNNIFTVLGGMGSSQIYQIVIYNNKLFSRPVGSYDETSMAFGGVEDREEFYTQILNGGVIQK